MNAPADNYVRSARLIRVIDGDTLRVEIDQGSRQRFECDLRLRHVDTPEKRGPESPAGRFVHGQVIRWLSERMAFPLAVKTHKWQAGKFGRYLAEVWCGDECLNDWLIDSGYGWPMDERGSVTVPRDIETLSIPEWIKQLCRENVA